MCSRAEQQIRLNMAAALPIHVSFPLSFVKCWYQLRSSFPKDNFADSWLVSDEMQMANSRSDEQRREDGTDSGREARIEQAANVRFVIASTHRSSVV